MRLKNWLLKLILMSYLSAGVNLAVGQDDNYQNNSQHNNFYIPEITLAAAVTTILSKIDPTVTAIAIGGGLGAISRYTVSQGVGNWLEGSFYGTMAVNVVGSFALGLITGRAARDETMANSALLHFMTTGFMGGFTTFSTFSKDVVTIAREEGIGFTALYTGFSIGVSVALILLGEIIGIYFLP